MSNEETEHIMFLKEQILRFAAAVNHKHSKNDITDIDESYAPKQHDSNSDIYGVGTNNKYGHLKVNNNVTGDNIDSSMPVSATGIINYVTTQINNIASTLRNELQDKLNIKNTINSSSTHQTDSKYNIPTTKAVWDAISDYKDLLVGIDLGRPSPINKNIDSITDAGYYIQTGSRNFSYGGETIYYTNALITIERQDNRVIQHVSATSKITNGADITYKINGATYRRWGAMQPSGSMIWNSWEVEYKPYTKTVRACNPGPGIGADAVRVFENSSGFIIHWDQYESDGKYPVTADLYEYQTICEFQPPLPITGPYVFGNLIGRFDIKITENNMQIRSNVNKGGRIIEVRETYFVPRNN